MAKANKGSKVASATPKEDGAVTVGGNRREVEVNQVMDEINNIPEPEVKEEEFDHRSDEEKNQEGFAEIIKEYREKYKGEEPTEQKESEESEEQESDKGDELSTDIGEPDDNSSESEDEPQTKTETQEKADDESPVIPKVLIDSALDMGVTPEEIQKVKSVDDLTKIVDALKSLPQKEEEAKEEEPEPDPLDKIVLKREDFEDEIVDAVEGLKDMVRELRDQNKNLVEKEEARTKEIAEQQHIAFLNSFDMAIDEYENEELFGSFEKAELPEEAIKNREKLYNEADKIAKVYPEYTMKQAIDEAAKKAFGDGFNKKQAKEAEVKDKLEKRSQSMLGKPSQREAIEEVIDTSTKEGRLAAATAAAKEFMAGLKK